MKIILLYANEYSMADEKTGEVNEGISVNYLCTSDLNPYRESKQTAGYKPAKGVIPVAERDNLIGVPGIYEAETHISIDRDGRPIIRLKGVTYVADVVAPVKK